MAPGGWPLRVAMVAAVAGIWMAMPVAAQTPATTPPPTPADRAAPKVAEITRGLAAIVSVCRERAPAATIIVTAIIPRNDSLDVLPEIARINANLAALADGRRVRYLNINDRLADANGLLCDGVTNPDTLHLAVPGYQVWADALKPMFTEFLGPPSATDHAPPPTGDPSAQR